MTPNRLRDLTDRELVIEFQAGTREAYDEVYRRYGPRVMRVCRRMLDDARDAEEASQETFLKAYQALDRFNGRYQLGAWLARIAANVCVDHLRVRARSAPTTGLADTEIPVEETPERILVGDQPRLDEAIAEIQPLHARALKLRAVDGLSHKEMAGHLAMTPEQVKALLHRARSSLRRAWDQAEGWILAPLLGARNMWQRPPGRTAEASNSLVPMGTSFGPLAAEKLAASAVILAVALSGAPSAPSAPEGRNRSSADSKVTASGSPGHRSHRRALAPDRTQGGNAEQATNPALAAAAPAPPNLPSIDPPKKRLKERTPDDPGPFDPGAAESKRVVRKAKQAIDEVTRPR